LTVSAAGLRFIAVADEPGMDPGHTPQS
jgi:hypothetical protein